MARELRAKSSPQQAELYGMFCDAYPNVRLSARAGIYVASLSANGNQLSQWRAYAGNGSGYCIGFLDLPRRVAVSEALELSVMPCEYDDTLFAKKVEQTLALIGTLFETKLAEGRQKHKNLLWGCYMLAYERCGSLVPRLKHASFAEENEWRVIVLDRPRRRREHPPQFRITSKGLVPYVEIPMTVDPCMSLASVRVGPCQPQDLGCEVTRMFVESHGYRKEIVMPSDIPYRP